jgi:hypothetical protein
MRARSIVLTLALCAGGLAVCVAADPHTGTWKLNEAQSKIAAGNTKNHTVVYADTGDSVKVTVDGTDADGKPVHSEWTGKFDGKEYPVTGDSTADMRSYTKVDDRTLSMTNKMGGKITMTARIVVSADGKSRTVTVSRTDAAGKKVTSTAMYDKQ